jgi:predicted  nucleic acid-binding Zn-ribbon protein
MSTKWMRGREVSQQQYVGGNFAIEVDRLSNQVRSLEDALKSAHTRLNEQTNEIIRLRETVRLGSDSLKQELSDAYEAEQSMTELCQRYLHKHDAAGLEIKAEKERHRVTELCLSQLKKDFKKALAELEGINTEPGSKVSQAIWTMLEALNKAEK